MVLLEIGNLGMLDKVGLRRNVELGVFWLQDGMFFSADWTTCKPLAHTRLWAWLQLGAWALTRRCQR